VKHELVIDHAGAKSLHTKVACKGKGSPLCASRAEDRAAISFVRASR